MNGEEFLPIIVVELGPVADTRVGLERDALPTAEQLAPSPAGEFGQGLELFQFRHAARPLWMKDYFTFSRASGWSCS